MNAFSTAAIPFLCCAVAFLTIGMVQADVTFLSVGAGFVVAGIPMLVMGMARRRAEKKG